MATERTLIIAACIALLSGCASSGAALRPHGAAKETSSSSRAVDLGGMRLGGQRPWSFPRVTFPGPPVLVAAGIGADPITASGAQLIRSGAGGRVGAKSHIQVHVLVQSWDRSVIEYDTWSHLGHAEPPPPGRLGAIVFGAVQGYRAQSVVEIVLPKAAKVPGVAGTTVMLIEVDAV